MRATKLCCLLMGLIAVTLADEKSNVMAISKACLAESKATEKEVENFWGPNANFDNVSPNMKCQLKCVMNKMGHLKGGVLDVEKAAKDWKNGPNSSKVNLNAFTTCKTEKGENDCETAYKITKCLRTTKA